MRRKQIIAPSTTPRGAPGPRHCTRDLSHLLLFGCAHGGGTHFEFWYAELDQAVGNLERIF
jgi:hypothetical protein